MSLLISPQKQNCTAPVQYVMGMMSIAPIVEAWNDGSTCFVNIVCTDVMIVSIDSGRRNTEYSPPLPHQTSMRQTSMRQTSMRFRSIDVKNDHPIGSHKVDVLLHGFTENMACPSVCSFSYSSFSVRLSSLSGRR